MEAGEKLKFVIIQEMNLKGAPVFFKKRLLAICEKDTDERLLRCLEARYFSRQVFKKYLRDIEYSIQNQLSEILKRREASTSRSISEIERSSEEINKLYERLLLLEDVF